MPNVNLPCYIDTGEKLIRKEVKVKIDSYEPETDLFKLRMYDLPVDIPGGFFCGIL